MKHIALVVIAGCAATEPLDGVEVETIGRMILPGEDRELCEVVRLPDDGAEHFAGRIETTMTAGSHHLIIATIDPGSPTEAAVREGDVIDCVGPSGFGEHIKVLTGSQQLEHAETYPEGTARAYRGGQLVVFNYHYFNATDAPIEARATLALRDVPADRVTRLMGDAAFVNLDIAIPPGASRVFTTDCRFDRDVMVHLLTRHTHRWGTDMPVYFAGGAHDGELIYVSPNYEDADHVFAEPVLVRAGEGFRFDCNYTNDTAADLVFGVKATDEMCILFAQIYAPDAREAPLQLCVVDEPEVP